MTQRKIKTIDGGSPEYWRQRTEGFRLIMKLNALTSASSRHRNTYPAAMMKMAI